MIDRRGFIAGTMGSALAAGGVERDVTDKCTYSDGRWTLPGAMLSRVGGELTTDKSLPAALVRFI